VRGRKGCDEYRNWEEAKGDPIVVTTANTIVTKSKLVRSTVVEL
jgi:hypothetical protein